MYRYNKTEKVAAMNPDQIIEFIGYNFDKMEKADDIEDTKVHADCARPSKRVQ